MLESAVENEPSVFEPLKFYCICMESACKTTTKKKKKKNMKTRKGMSRVKRHKYMENYNAKQNKICTNRHDIYRIFISYLKPTRKHKLPYTAKISVDFTVK